MITCFENLIGIKGYCEDTPSTSGLYVQQLPFMSFKNIDAVLFDNKTAAEFLNEKIQMASNYLVQDSISIMSPFYKQTSILAHDTVGYFNKDKQVISGITDNYKGVYVRILRYPYLNFHLSSIKLFVDYTGTVDVKVIDLNQGKVLDTIQVDAVQGEVVTVDIDKSYPTNRQRLDLFICYDSTDIDSYKTNLYSVVAQRTCNGCNGDGAYYGNGYVQFFNRKLDLLSQPIYANLNNVNDTGGLSFDYSLECTIEPFLCSIKNRLAMPLLHRIGMEIINEMKASDRLNSTIVLQRKEIDSFYEYYENEYKKELTNIFSKMKLPNDICFNCNKTFGVSIAIP